MHDGEALLRSILEAPDDDGPRLVYADWLDERGNEGDADRAEFIRLQIALFRMENGPDWKRLDPKLGVFHNPQRGGLDFRPTPAMRERDKVRQRARVILGYRGGGWHDISPMPDVRADGDAARPDTFTLFFRRGFVERVECRTADFLRHAANLFAAQPVTEVRLADREPRSGPGGWGWADEGVVLSDPIADRHLIPPALWKLIPEQARKPVGSPWGVRPWIVWKWFPTAAAAHAALSRAACRYGRGLAGLNPAAGARV